MATMAVKWSDSLCHAFASPARGDSATWAEERFFLNWICKKNQKTWLYLSGVFLPLLLLNGELHPFLKIKSRGFLQKKRLQPHRSDQDSAIYSEKRQNFGQPILWQKQIGFWIPQGSWIFTFFLENYVMSEERKYIYNPKEWHYQKNN